MCDSDNNGAVKDRHLFALQLLWLRVWLRQRHVLQHFSHMWNYDVKTHKDFQKCALQTRVATDWRHKDTSSTEDVRQKKLLTSKRGTPLNVCLFLFIFCCYCCGILRFFFSLKKGSSVSMRWSYSRSKHQKNISMDHLSVFVWKCAVRYLIRFGGRRGGVLLLIIRCFIHS